MCLYVHFGVYWYSTDKVTAYRSPPSLSPSHPLPKMLLPKTECVEILDRPSLSNSLFLCPSRSLSSLSLSFARTRAVSLLSLVSLFLSHSPSLRLPPSRALHLSLSLPPSPPPSLPALSLSRSLVCVCARALSRSLARSLSSLPIFSRSLSFSRERERGIGRGDEGGGEEERRRSEGGGREGGREGERGGGGGREGRQRGGSQEFCFIFACECAKMFAGAQRHSVRLGAGTTLHAAAPPHSPVFKTASTLFMGCKKTCSTSAGFVNATRARSGCTSGGGRFRFLLESRHLGSGVVSSPRHMGSGGISSPMAAAGCSASERAAATHADTCLRPPGSPRRRTPRRLPPSTIPKELPTTSPSALPRSVLGLAPSQHLSGS
jgi:hypothetical protein